MDELPLPPTAELPGKRVTRQLVAAAATRVDTLDPDTFDFGDFLSLNIAYEQMRLVLRKHGRH